MTRPFAAALLALLLADCAMTQVAGVMHPAISGDIDLRRADGTGVHWIPDRCSSGDHALFVGFDFLSTHDDGHLRVVLVNSLFRSCKFGSRDVGRLALRRRDALAR